MSDERGVMSSEEPIHGSLMKVTPTSGKGTLGFGGSYNWRGLGLIKPGIPNRRQGQGRSCGPTNRRRGVCAPALKLRGGWEGSQRKCQGFKPDLGNSAVRHYRGASENVVTVEMGSHLATERVRLVTLHLPLARLSSIPTNWRRFAKPIG
jgi:hypothetical protein